MKLQLGFRGAGFSLWGFVLARTKNSQAEACATLLPAPLRFASNELTDLARVAFKKSALARIDFSLPETKKDLIRFANQILFV